MLIDYWLYSHYNCEEVKKLYRKVDKLGRLVIPKEIRKHLNIKNGDVLHIEIKNNKIILEKDLSLEELAKYRDEIDRKIKELTQL